MNIEGITAGDVVLSVCGLLFTGVGWLLSRNLDAATKSIRAAEVRGIELGAAILALKTEVGDLRTERHADREEMRRYQDAQHVGRQEMSALAARVSLIESGCGFRHKPSIGE